MNKFFLSSFFALAFSLNSFAQITITPQVLNAPCFNNCTGRITLSVLGGLPPYAYAWSNGSTTQNLSNLCAGSYTVTIVDAAQLSITQTFTITEPAPLLASSTSFDATCYGLANGSIVTTVTGGTMPYTYAWSTGSNQSNHLNLYPGFYHLTLTDANGCTASLGDTVGAISNVVVQPSLIKPGCGQANGTVTLNTSGGFPPFTYQINGGPQQTTNVFAGLPSGSYQFTVNDSVGCALTKTVDLFKINLVVDTLIPADCSNKNGAITVLAGAGVPPYTYQWSTGASGPTISNLSAGGYSVTVTDSAGCSRHINIALPFAGNCVGTIKGRVYFDHNSNCTFDAGDAPAAFRLVNIGNGFVTTDTAGFYSVTLPLDTYIVRAILQQYDTVICPTGGFEEVVLMQATTINEIDFAINGLAYKDASIIAFAGVARPGFTSNIWVQLNNHSNIPGNATGTATLTLDSRVTANSATNGGVVSGNTVSWNYNIPIGGIAQMIVTVTIAPPPTVNIGDMLTHIAALTPTSSDSFSVNNVDTVRQLVQGSYDPNDKLVFPTGDFLAKDTVFNYTIRFQNTGNDTAFTVVIRDTLDDKLNPYTFRNFTSSHPMTPVFVASNIIEFRFNDINLPDSFVNEPASHGYVSFYINRYKNLTVGSVIKNSASIYFDFNPPIKTNTVENTLINPLSSIQEINTNVITIYPNPAADRFYIAVENKTFHHAALFDLNGAKVAESKQPEIAVSALPQGLYVCRIQLSDASVHYTKVMVK